MSSILTGFYNLSKLNNDELKEFFIDAIYLAYNVHIDIIYGDSSHRRTRTTDKTIQDMLDNISTEHHNVCVDRSIQFDKTDYGEIGYCTLDSPDYILYIFVTLENLNKLVEKYKLIMK